MPSLLSRGFTKIGHFWGVPITRIVIFQGLYWGVPLVSIKGLKLERNKQTARILSRLSPSKSRQRIAMMTLEDCNDRSMIRGTI